MAEKTQFMGKPGAKAPNGGQKVTVWERATGRATTVWPVDARELVASGEYSLTPPAPAEAAPSEAPPAGEPPAGAEPPSGADAGANTAGTEQDPAKVDPAPVDPRVAEMLEQPAAAVVQLVLQIDEVPLLQALAAAERAGKGRKTVLDALTAALKADAGGT